MLRHDGPLEEGAPAVSEAGSSGVTGADVSVTDGARAILFATPTCPNCRIACSYLDKAGFAYEKLMAEENADLAIRYVVNQAPTLAAENVQLALDFGVKQAPTLVIIDGKSFEKFAGAGAIKEFLSKKV